MINLLTMSRPSRLELLATPLFRPQISLGLTSVRNIKSNTLFIMLRGRFPYEGESHVEYCKSTILLGCTHEYSYTISLRLLSKKYIKLISNFGKFKY
jgi:hypothetical protein